MRVVRPHRGKWSLNPKPKIQYLNTDLDLVSSCSLDDLCAEITERELCGHVTHGEDGLWYAMFEDCNAEEPEPNIKNLLDALDQLSPAAVQVLRQCTKIEFNIGYDCGDEPWSFNQGLSHETLRRIVEHGASLRVTLYPYIPPGDPRIKSTDVTDLDN
jgi:hypothetical protein